MFLKNLYRKFLFFRLVIVQFQIRKINKSHYWNNFRAKLFVPIKAKFILSKRFDDNNDVLYFRSRTGWINILLIIHTWKIQIRVHIMGWHFIEPIWILGCQIASKEKALLPDTHARIWKSVNFANFQIFPESMTFL